MITCALLLLLAQAPQQPPPQTTTTTAAVLDDYNLGIADIINVTVFGEPDASRLGATVDNDGTIDMPLIGRVKVAGKTARAVEKEIKDRLAGKYLVNPSVSIEIIKYRSKIITVQGYVHSPGEYPLEGNVSITSALAKAGSMTLDAGSYVMISRRSANGATEQIKVTRKDIESGQAQGVMLKDGDTVLVPKAEHVFVNGQVRAPGSYTWEEGLTIERALTLAGGPTERAGKITIERSGKTVTKNARKTDLVVANDTIRVGNRIF
ncbi:MAG TPA: polysaccharide biosynthesis/export family protein [Vicinamibacterales bacterium]